MDIKEAKEALLGRDGRARCWAARDGYYACLDGNSGKGVTVTVSACEELKRDFEAKCPQSWVRCHGAASDLV